MQRRNHTGRLGSWLMKMKTIVSIFDLCLWLADREKSSTIPTTININKHYYIEWIYQQNMGKNVSNIIHPSSLYLVASLSKPLHSHKSECRYLFVVAVVVVVLYSHSGYWVSFVDVDISLLAALFVAVVVCCFFPRAHFIRANKIECNASEIFE